MAQLLIIIFLGIMALLTAPFELTEAPAAEIAVALATSTKFEQVPPAASEPQTPATSTAPIAAPSEKKPDDSAIIAEIAKNIQAAKKQLENIHIPVAEPMRTRLSQEILYRIGSGSVVNFFCQKGSHTTLATGVIIDSRGYVLTNAHIASEDTGEPACVLRNGSPAATYALAKRVFTAPNFSDTLLESENLKKDVAIWKITALTHGAPLTSFPPIPVNPTFTVSKGTPLATFSYPAELLGSQAISQSLYLAFSETTVALNNEYFIESEHGIGSQKGSSGGILIDPYTGKFAGLIFAISEEDGKLVSDRKTLSLTPFAIDEVIRNAKGTSLAEYLATNP